MIEIEFGDVDQVDADEPPDGDPDRIDHVGVGDGVDGVDFVLVVEVGVEAVHHHHELVGGRPAAARIDDERAVEPLVDVALERNGVTVIQVQPAGSASNS